VILERCITVPEKEFFDRYFGQRFLHGAAGDLELDTAELFSAEVLESLLGDHGLRNSAFVVVKDTKETDLGRTGFPDGRETSGFSRHVDTERLRRAFATGHTLVAAVGASAPIRRCAGFAHALSADLGHPAHINASSHRRTRREWACTSTLRMRSSCRSAARNYGS